MTNEKTTRMAITVDADQATHLRVLAAELHVSASVLIKAMITDSFGRLQAEDPQTIKVLKTVIAEERRRRQEAGRKGMEVRWAQEGQ